MAPISILSASSAADYDEAKLSVTAIILTLDEEVHIERCIMRLSRLVEHIVVVDSFSNDRTVDIARSLGAEVVQRAFKHQADQFQWALDSLDIRTDWILRLDADEYLEPELVEEIRARLSSLPPSVTGVRLKRKLIFRDKWIRFGGYYPTVLLRLWRRGQAHVQQLWMDEHVVLKGGEAIVLSNNFCDHNLRDITWWTEKHNRYATRKMADFIAMEQGVGNSNGTAANADASRALKRFLQYTVFLRAPLYLRAVMLFIYRYVFRLGVLDGKHGFVWHSLQGFWYTMLIDAKVEEARIFIAAQGFDAFKAHLADRHGITIQ